MKSVLISTYSVQLSPIELADISSSLRSVSSRWPVDAARRALELESRLHGRTRNAAEDNDRPVEGRAA